MITAIVGGNWGDEGKGKMVDLLAENCDIVVRFQGGANAGHTIINQYGKFALHLIPSGVFHTNITNVIGQGVAFDIEAFHKEYHYLIENGIKQPKIIISDRAQIVMPYHKLLDALEEERLGKNSFGSTKSGIAPFYSDKCLKIGIQVGEIFDDEILKQRLENICNIKNVIIKELYKKDIVLDPQELYAQLVSYRDELKPLIENVTTFLSNAIKENKKILLEGQLGALRDTDNGIYPFVTSSSPLAGFATVGAGIPAGKIDEVITVVKAYSSCVGAGAFVSEIFDEEAHELRERGGDGGEYGATTGRPRRMGYFDAVASKYGCMLQGSTQVVLSLLDVLGYLDKIPVCVAYNIDGKLTTDFPVTPQLNKATPVYEYLDGWNCPISHITKYDDLPTNAKKYVDFIEQQIGYPITLISNGAKRENIIKRIPKI